MPKFKLFYEVHSSGKIIHDFVITEAKDEETAKWKMFSYLGRDYGCAPKYTKVIKLED